MPLFGTICELAEEEEFHVDSTFKTNRTGHELFGIVATVNGVGVRIAYLLLKMTMATNTTTTNTTTASDVANTTSPSPTVNTFAATHDDNFDGMIQVARSDIIAHFFTKLKELGLDPISRVTCP
ncbi:hypothetical protein BDA99DRAFT_568737 [Phascolomyces articulosus]|uniref:Uncharacterized protein n=1 Tax=Phascolomyces articulosus TaxID=60185 RepID=A0AAD5PI17_9FUNG|nr:hypothetical protein BDA99DRAFT_568737 [Phascolomyces articulosus]